MDGHMSDYVYPCGRYLTNWARSRFEIDATEYNCAEQWIMANKAIVSNDEVRTC